MFRTWSIATVALLLPFGALSLPFAEARSASDSASVSVSIVKRAPPVPLVVAPDALAMTLSELRARYLSARIVERWERTSAGASRVLRVVVVSR